MDEDAGQCTPNFVGSVLRLYKKELQKLKENQNYKILKQTFSEYKNTGYAKISLLVLGQDP